MSGASNEQCFQFSECDKLTPFITKGKAVFEVEYAIKPPCATANAMHFSTAKANLDLNGKTWIPCWAS